MSTTALLRTLRRELANAGDPERAVAMQAYMKSAMPFHGVPAPVVRRICKEVFAGHGIADADGWRADVLGIFRGAEKREEWYAAVELCRDKRARAFQHVAVLPLYDEIITRSAWWDVVDTIASHQLGAILRNDPKPMRQKMLAWSRDANMWRARSAILCQLGFKGDTDVELLYACIEPSLGSKEFFLRKAIGWALRQLAWTDAAEVERYVAKNRERMSNLSVREALKNVSRPTSSPARGARRRSA